MAVEVKICGVDREETVEASVDAVIALNGVERTRTSIILSTRVRRRP